MKNYKPTKHSVLHSAYCMIYAMCYEYGKVIFNGLDWMGKKLVYLIDHSDFFAGCVVTMLIVTLWEMLTK